METRNSGALGKLGGPVERSERVFGAFRCSYLELFGGFG